MAQEQIASGSTWKGALYVGSGPNSQGGVGIIISRDTTFREVGPLRGPNSFVILKLEKTTENGF